MRAMLGEISFPSELSLHDPQRAQQWARSVALALEAVTLHRREYRLAKLFGWSAAARNWKVQGYLVLSVEASHIDHRSPQSIRQDLG